MTPDVSILGWAHAVKAAQEQLRPREEPPRDDRVIDLSPSMFEDITDRKALTHGPAVPQP